MVNLLSSSSYLSLLQEALGLGLLFLNGVDLDREVPMSRSVSTEAILKACNT